MAENKTYISSNLDKGNINISEDVIASIASSAAAEVEGVVAVQPLQSKELSSIMGKKSATKGVKIKSTEGNITADIYIIAKLGACLSTIGREIQEKVKENIEETTSHNVCEVNVHIIGVK